MSQNTETFVVDVVDTIKRSIEVLCDTSEASKDSVVIDVHFQEEDLTPSSIVETIDITRYADGHQDIKVTEYSYKNMDELVRTTYTGTLLDECRGINDRLEEDNIDDESDVDE